VKAKCILYKTWSIQGLISGRIPSPNREERAHGIKVYYGKASELYRVVEYLGDVHILGFPHPFFAVVADSGTAVGVTQFLADEMGYLPEVVIVTDNPPEEHREEITRELTDNIESIFKPDVQFESDSHRIRLKLRDRSFLALLTSSLEKFIAPELGAAIHLRVSFPSFDRLILERSYAGFGGGLTLMEDILSKIVAPL
jgi:nitrogenase molybdenum-iron protein beta chain